MELVTGKFIGPVLIQISHRTDSFRRFLLTEILLGGRYVACIYNINLLRIRFIFLSSLLLFTGRCLITAVV
jgi:hypothetical protein